MHGTGPSRCRHRGSAQSAQNVLHHAASVNSGHQQQRHWPSSTRLHAMQDLGTASTEPLAQPLAICKNWLLSVFPLLRNEELVSRVAWTAMIIAIARLGLYIKLPYLDPQVVPQASYKASKPLSCLVQIGMLRLACMRSLLSEVPSTSKWKAADAQQMLPCLAQSNHCVTQA